MYSGNVDSNGHVLRSQALSSPCQTSFVVVLRVRYRETAPATGKVFKVGRRCRTNFFLVDAIGMGATHAVPRGKKGQDAATNVVGTAIKVPVVVVVVVGPQIILGCSRCPAKASQQQHKNQVSSRVCAKEITR